MRGVVPLLLVIAACAAGEGRGTATASFGSGTAPSSTSASTDTGTATGSTADTTSDSEATGTETSAMATTGEVGDTTTAPGTETGEAPPCDAALESFVADPGWTVVGLPDAGNVFGWSASANAGGAVGELGGTLQRAGVDQRIADTSIAVVDGDCIAASGRIVATMEADDYNSIVNFGHFGTGGGAFIGFSLGESSGQMLRVYMQAGAFSEEVYLLEDIATPRTWSYAYDPVAATMTLELEGLGSITRPLAPDDVDSVAGIDAFGLFKTPHETPEMYPGLLGLFLDEIEYTR